MFCSYIIFFFSSRRRHTRCYRDWSSDVCSSDLVDLWQLKAKALEAAAESSPSKENSRAQVEMLLPMMAEAVEADNYEAALALGKIAEVAARKSKVIALVTSVQKRQEEVQAVQKGFARLQVYVD